MLPYWFTALLMIGATHRLTRMVTTDAIPFLRVPREWLDRKLGSEHWLSYLTQCDWCSSVWVSGGLTTGLWAYAEYVHHDQPWVWPYWVLMGLTASTATGLIASRESSDD